MEAAMFAVAAEPPPRGPRISELMEKHRFCSGIMSYPPVSSASHSAFSRGGGAACAGGRGAVSGGRAGHLGWMDGGRRRRGSGLNGREDLGGASSRSEKLHRVREFVALHWEELDGHLPTRATLSRLGRKDLMAVIRQLGGPAVVAAQLGLQPPVLECAAAAGDSVSSNSAGGRGCSSGVSQRKRIKAKATASGLQSGEEHKVREKERQIEILRRLEIEKAERRGDYAKALELQDKFQKCPASEVAHATRGWGPMFQAQALVSDSTSAAAMESAKPLLVSSEFPSVDEIQGQSKPDLTHLSNRFSLPPDETQIEQQIKTALARGCVFMVEYHRTGNPSDPFWIQWKLPIIRGNIDEIYKSVFRCSREYSDHYVRISAIDTTRNCEQISILLYDPTKKSAD